ncbi:amino acid ABC transporter substrate-binding protein [Helicobacter muridarum]|uniref:Amino acid ABC transporter substrate-binding protein n=1 Tax=Helicobacter muridarum TaxID=216 RepID=A0A099U1N0_9HELI|nr:transporter substrate-binding domain-containing protein [Helicobacter muridarum]TLE00910.1 amino acid ABC transporter substrate-binding protein [Helicobacter muridarum]STQ86685.1 polar amino acid ABC transporter periplasmic protein [Helicobacter muridarum]
MGINQIYKLCSILFAAIVMLGGNVFSKDNQLLIVAGSENAYKPFAYLDSKNNPLGFDNEVLQVVVSYIPESKLQIVSVPWNVIFTGLDSGKFDVVANQITKNDEREKKYIFSNKPYFYGVSGLIIGNNSNITHIKDLKNVKVGVTVGSNHAINIEKYVKENPKQNISIIYYKTSPAIIADLANGRIQAMINDPASAVDYAKSQGVYIKVTDFVFEKIPIYFIFRKDSIELSKTIDQALERAIQDGKISEISIKYFGVDQTK